LKRILVLAALGVLGPIVQGAVSPYLPRGLCPDGGLLLVVAIGLTLRSTLSGVLLAAWVGFVSDLLSGSLLGQHTIARVCVFGVARLAGFQMNLQGGFAQVVLTGAVTLVSSALLAGLTAFFTAGAAAPMASPVEIGWHAAVNALCAPVAVAFVARVVRGLGDEDGRRVLPLEPRSFA
jgi:rod shape-determining protein MreD